MSEPLSHVIDVIVPVYRGLDATRRCLEAAMRAPQSCAFELVIVDDCVPEPELAAWLRTLAGQPEVTLLENTANMGFVTSVNRAMTLHPDRDVVLLNSDTEVANDWLDRLRRCAYAEANIGTVTPFSNNATICSFPVFCADNPLPPGVTPAMLDGVFSRANAGRYLDIPTAVGFCMYIKRACLEETGLFDAGRFGSGYGEENDFSRRTVALGWRNVLCADTFVYHVGGVSFADSGAALRLRNSEVLRALHPEYDAAVAQFVASDPPRALREAASVELARSAGTGWPVQLHVIHDLGGGAAKWLKDFAEADATRINLVLRPLSFGTACGEGVALYRSPFDEVPLGTWLFSPPIEATVVAHDAYRRVLEQIVREHDISAIIVSSLIGHSLDVLKTGLPTLIVNHDYYPYCPAINLHFDGICQHCDDARMLECQQHNQAFAYFPAFSGEMRQAVRAAWRDSVCGGSATVVCPSASVAENFRRLEPCFAGVPFHVIPHSHADHLPFLELHGSEPGERLRVLVLGQISAAKGMSLLLDAVDELTRFADLFLLGCGEVGEIFRFRPGINIVSRYDMADLPQHVRNIQPDVGLLASICAETFSFTLSELMAMGVPPVASAVGSFPERITQGETGYLFPPRADELVRTLRALSTDKSALVAIRANLRAKVPRPVEEMIEAYHRLLPTSLFPAPGGRQPQDQMTEPKPIPPQADTLTERHALLLADMWKELQRLRTIVSLNGDSQSRLDRHCANLDRIIADRDLTLRSIQDELSTAHIQIGDQTMRLHSALEEVAVSKRLLLARNGDLDAILSSTSWRLSAPIRWIGHGVRRTRQVGRCLAPLRHNPREIAPTLKELYQAWRVGGMVQLKRHLLHLTTHLRSVKAAWQDLQQRLQDNRPAMLARLECRDDWPTISILVPTYNTPEGMLAEMLASVTGQIYPYWELCIADDASTRPHMRRMLEAAAAADKRIRLHLGTENHGVSHASNRALALARSQFTVLLDHDDVLEPQALLRVAESVVTDRPDMLYSDEVLIKGVDSHVEQFVFRPVFSPEYLRAHPYIVHLVGFRTALLREIGGFDESLAISQDYDLILRASEKASVIVHVPEVLYRWRQHQGSAGHDRQRQVMETSMSILQRHLERCGEAGNVAAGEGFNFFEVAYRLTETVRVAIVIPTKNHGDLVRQCIDSIRRTVSGINYDITVIDHDSDDPGTLAYLAEISGEVQVLRYSGVFNFSTINNWAIAQLDTAYTHYLLCNNDIEATHPGWLDRMLELGQHSDVGIVGAMLYYPDGETIQHAGVCVGAFGIAEHYAKPLRLAEPRLRLTAAGRLVVNHEVSAVTAACLLISKQAFDEVNGMDEALAVGFGDVDLCLKVLGKGFRVMFCPHAELLHHESYTRGASTVDPHPEDSARFRAKWARFLRDGDPYFNPGFNLYTTTWDLKLPLNFNLDQPRRVYTRGAGRQTIHYSQGLTTHTDAVG